MNKMIVSALLCAFAASASASDKVRCTHYPEHERMNVRTLQQKLLNEGYVIREFDYDLNCFKVKVRDESGQKIKLYLDAKSGKEVSRRVKNR